MENYYEILEVAENASDEEIKKAFKKKAFALHPDRNKEPDAEIRFKKANEAYQILSNADKRAEYDYRRQNGDNSFPFDMFNNVPPFFNMNGSGMGGGIEDILREMFGVNIGNNKKVIRAEKKYFINLEDVLQGKEEEIPVGVYVPCITCNVTGIDPNSIKNEINCKNCEGKGKVAFKKGAFQVHAPCNICKGKGKTGSSPCVTCNGEKEVIKSVTTKIQVPAGIKHGNVLEIPVAIDGFSGSIFIEVNITTHKEFEFDHYGNLKTKRTISYPGAVFGTTIEIPSLNGEILKIKIPEGINHGQTVRIQGKGTPIQVGNKNDLGDLYIDIFIDIPKKLTKKQKEQLEEYQKTLEEI